MSAPENFRGLDVNLAQIQRYKKLEVPSRAPIQCLSPSWFLRYLADRDVEFLAWVGGGGGGGEGVAERQSPAIDYQEVGLCQDKGSVSHNLRLR